MIGSLLSYQSILKIDKLEENAKKPMNIAFKSVIVDEKYLSDSENGIDAQIHLHSRKIKKLLKYKRIKREIFMIKDF